VFDSATKIPSGLLYGNIVQLGNFDECLAVDEKSLGFSGRWCRVVITKAEVMDRHDDDSLSVRELMLLPLKHALVNASSHVMVRIHNNITNLFLLYTIPILSIYKLILFLIIILFYNF
jgi:hypothetical protein